MKRLINFSKCVRLYGVICAGLFFSAESFAYKVEMHSKMTEVAAKRSVLSDRDLWSEWGIDQLKKNRTVTL